MTVKILSNVTPPTYTTRILSIDPGAKRLGYAVIDFHPDGELQLIESGIDGLNQGNLSYSAYRWKLIEYWLGNFPKVLAKWTPDLIVSEVLPFVGSNSLAITQRIHGLTALCVCQAIALQKEYEWKEIAANTIKKIVADKGTASKAKVRDAVIETFPELKERKGALTRYADEADAIAVGLAGIIKYGTS